MEKQQAIRSPGPCHEDALTSIRIRLRAQPSDLIGGPCEPPAAKSGPWALGGGKLVPTWVSSLRPLAHWVTKCPRVLPPRSEVTHTAPSIPGLSSHPQALLLLNNSVHECQTPEKWGGLPRVWAHQLMPTRPHVKVTHFCTFREGKGTNRRWRGE